ncbi:conserved hypothetical protein, partial [Ricinus communis]
MDVQQRVVALRVAAVAQRRVVQVLAFQRHAQLRRDVVRDAHVDVGGAVDHRVVVARHVAQHGVDIAGAVRRRHARTELRILVVQGQVVGARRQAREVRHLGQLLVLRRRRIVHARDVRDARLHARRVREQAEIAPEAGQEAERRLQVEFPALQRTAGRVDLATHVHVRRGQGLADRRARQRAAVQDQEFVRETQRVVGHALVDALDEALDILAEVPERDHRVLRVIPLGLQVVRVGADRVQVRVADRDGLRDRRHGGVRREVRVLGPRQRLAGREAQEHILRQLRRQVEGGQPVAVFLRAGVRLQLALHVDHRHRRGRRLRAAHARVAAPRHAEQV